MRAKMGKFDGIVVQSVLYGCETWALDKKLWKKANVLEMKCLRKICGVRRIYL